MTSYTIRSLRMILGTYEGATAQDALDAMACDAGYADHTAQCDVTGDDEDDWTESFAAFVRGTGKLLVESVQS